MPAPRPQSYVALALATLAVTLATWWAFDTISGFDPSDEEGAPPSSAPLTADEYPPRDPPTATPEVSDEPTPPTPPMLQSGRPPLNPPEQVAPEAVAPEAFDPGPAEDEAPYVEEGPAKEEPPGADYYRSRARRTSLLGGVDRINARATEEILVEASSAWIGTPERWVRSLAAQRAKAGYVALLMEAPRHRVENIESFFIDRYEVSNHRYWEFLRDTASVLYRTSDHPPRTLLEVVDALILNPPTNLDLADVTGRQLFLANSAALLQAFKDALVRTDDDTVDLDATYERIRERILPNGLDLRFYNRAPPGTWREAIYPDQRGSYPVRDVSIEDAIAFSLYRGRHVPTELQWEYAARGTTGLDWPWGGDGSLFDEVVNGGQPRAADEQPRTAEVFQFADGRSPIGAAQMLGNVSEWTSSFLDAYPGGTRTLPGSAERQVVVRGGSAFDQDRYLVRPAFRGWHASDPDGAPSILQRRAWTGFRTARFEQPAQSRLPTMHFRARQGRRIDKDLLEPTIFAGFEGLHVTRFVTIVGEGEDQRRLKPRPGVKSFVVQPFQVIGTIDRGRWRPNTDEGLTTLGQLHAQAAPILYGLVHTDLYLLDTWHSAVEPFNVFNPPTRLRREDVAPGTYLLGTVQGHVALFKTDLTDVWYLGNRPAPESTFNVIEQRYQPGVRRPRIERFRRRGRERVEFDFYVPMHASAEPGRAARLVVRLALDVRETRSLLGVETSDVRK